MTLLSKPIIGLIFYFSFITSGHALSLVSYNLYDIGARRSGTIQQLLDEIAQLKPDVVLLQEASKRTRAQLEQQVVFKGYRYHAKWLPDGSPAGGLITLTSPNHTPHHHEFYPLPSKLGRGYLRVFIYSEGQFIHIINVHLESDVLFEPGNEFRGRQLKRLQGDTKDYGTVIIAGDMNLADGDEEEQLKPADMIDVWQASYPDELRATWSPKNNKLAGFFWMKPMRLDRVWLKGALHVEKIKLLHTDIEPPLSDHYGLWLELR